jgi:hypothetical protein
MSIKGSLSPLDHNNRATHMIDAVVAHTAQEHPVQRSQLECGFNWYTNRTTERKLFKKKSEVAIVARDFY